MYKFNVDVVNNVEVRIFADNEDDAMQKFAKTMANFKLQEYADYDSLLASKDFQYEINDFSACEFEYEINDFSEMK